MTALFQTALEGRFNQPALWQWKDRIETRPGEFVRGGWAIPDNPRALVVVLGGLSEYIEKYFETFNDLLARGYAVAQMDWRGQGQSWRHADKHHYRVADDFDLDRIDIETFITMIPLEIRIPRIMLAHSMGANIGLRLLKSTRDHFRCAVMTAPMFGINMPIPLPLARLLAAGTRLAGLTHTYLPMSGGWDEKHFESNILRLTSDDGRRDMQRYWMKNEKLRMGGLTFDWLRAAFASIDIVKNPVWLRDIKTPVLLVEAEGEKIVSNIAIRRAAKALPNATLITVSGSLHEVLMERDVYRNQFWSAFDGFVAKYV